MVRHRCYFESIHLLNDKTPQIVTWQVKKIQKVSCGFGQRLQETIFDCSRNNNDYMSLRKLYGKSDYRHRKYAYQSGCL